MLTEVQKTILFSLSAFLAGEKYRPKEDIDWKEVVQESVAQAVILPCLQGIAEGAMPEEVRKVWRKYGTRSLQSNIKIHAHHAYVHTLMQEAGIKYVILKGSSSAYYYNDPLMRAMGDVDFLIAPKDVEKASTLLISKGFEQWDMKHACHIVFKREKMHLEMHFQPAGMPEGKMGDKIQEYLSDIYEKAEEVEINGNIFRKPSDFHHGLILLMHTYHHLLSEGVGLRHLCDFAVFMNSFEGESFEDVFKERLSAVGLWRFAYILSQLSHLYLGSPYRQWMGEVDKELCDAVIGDIFAGGNFGGKDQERSVQGMSISNRGKDGVKKSKIGQFFSSVNESGKTQYPRLAKIPVLKWFCFIPLGFRYLFRVLTGKRKRIKFAKNMKEAERRKQIYKQFQLFEVEEK